MGHGARNLDSVDRLPTALDTDDQWSEALRRLSQYDRDGLSVTLEDALEKFDAALAAGIANKA